MYSLVDNEGAEKENVKTQNKQNGGREFRQILIKNIKNEIAEGLHKNDLDVGLQIKMKDKASKLWKFESFQNSCLSHSSL